MKIIRITKDIGEKSYNLFDASSLNIGDKVLHNIYVKRSDSFIVVIEAGKVLTEKLNNMLMKYDNLYIQDDKPEEDVYISDEDENDQHCKNMLVKIKHNKHNLSKTLKLLLDANDYLFSSFYSNKKNKIDLECINDIVESLIFLIEKNSNYLKKVILSLNNDYKLPTHSFNVALYSLHIGYSIGLSKEELFKLGQAALLHDIGKKIIDPIVHKEDKLTLEELELTKQHANYSVDLIKMNAIEDEDIIKAVEQHHERCDGSGYPKGLKSGGISKFASIIAISDIFDALTIDRPHRKKYSTFEALKLMMKDPKTKNSLNVDYIRSLLV